MLRYDAAWLIEQYAEEPLAAPGIPYALLGESGPYRLLLEDAPYRPTQAVDIDLRLPYDETVVRLVRYESGTLWLQPCPYSDGVKSNYAMDRPGELREVLREQYGRRLPPLE